MGVNYIPLINMGLFSFSKPSENNAVQEVQLVLNDDSVNVPFEEVQGMSVAEVFRRFGSGMGDVARINRFVAQGRIVNATAVVEAGTVYSGAVASESKGAA